MRKQIVTAAVLAALGSVSANAMAAYTSPDGNTTIGGKMYADFTNRHLRSDGTSDNTSGNGIDVKRFYLGVTHDFSPIWSVNVTTDFNYLSSDGETQVFIKKAYVQGKFMPEAILRVGSADMPWIPYDEGLYGFRYVENTLIDRLGFGNSADWGVHFLGKAMDGKVNYAVSAVNGGGYKHLTRSKSLDVEARVGVQPIPGLHLAVGGYRGKLNEDITSATTYHTATRWDIIAAYVQPMYRAGFEYFSADNWRNVATAAGDKADGYSVWGAVTPINKVTFFARYDYAKPSKDLAPNLKDQYFNVGAQYQVRKNIDVALVYKHEKVDNVGAAGFKTSNGEFAAGTSSGKYDEIGFWTQVQF